MLVFTYEGPFCIRDWVNNCVCGQWAKPGSTSEKPFLGCWQNGDWLRITEGLWSHFTSAQITIKGGKKKRHSETTCSPVQAEVPPKNMPINKTKICISAEESTGDLKGNNSEDKWMALRNEHDIYLRVFPTEPWHALRGEDSELKRPPISALVLTNHEVVGSCSESGRWPSRSYFPAVELWMFHVRRLRSSWFCTFLGLL